MFVTLWVRILITEYDKQQNISLNYSGQVSGFLENIYRRVEYGTAMFY